MCMSDALLVCWNLKDLPKAGVSSLIVACDFLGLEDVGRCVLSESRQSMDVLGLWGSHVRDGLTQTSTVHHPPQLVAEVAGSWDCCDSRALVGLWGLGWPCRSLFLCALRHLLPCCRQLARACSTATERRQLRPRMWCRKFGGADFQGFNGRSSSSSQLMKLASLRHCSGIRRPRLQLAAPVQAS